MDGTLLEKKYDIVGRIKALEEGGGEPSANVIVEDDVAYQFSTTSSYLAGSFVYKDNQLYRFDVDHDAGDWNTEEVTAVRICDSIISEFGSGLQRTGNEVYVKLKSDGGLHFDANGAIYADHLPDYRLTEHKTGQQWIDGRDVYTRVFQYENGLQLAGNTWVNSGTSADIDICISCFGISNDGTTVPLCAYYDQSVGLQFLNVRTQTVTLHNFILTYVKPVASKKKTSK